MPAPLVSQAVSLIKGPALVSTIAIYDLTMKGEQIIADTDVAFEPWFSIAAGKRFDYSAPRGLWIQEWQNRSVKFRR